MVSPLVKLVVFVCSSSVVQTSTVDTPVFQFLWPPEDSSLNEDFLESDISDKQCYAMSDSHTFILEPSD